MFVVVNLVDDDDEARTMLLNVVEEEDEVDRWLLFVDDKVTIIGGLVTGIDELVVWDESTGAIFLNRFIFGEELFIFISKFWLWEADEDKTMDFGAAVGTGGGGANSELGELL